MYKVYRGEKEAKDRLSTFKRLRPETKTQAIDTSEVKKTKNKKQIYELINTKTWQMPQDSWVGYCPMIGDS